MGDLTFLLACFIGIDGSGKTTISKGVAALLSQKRGDKCYYVYGRVVPVLSRVLMWLGRRVLMGTSEKKVFCDYAKYVREKRKLLENSLASSMYELLVLFDQIVQINIKVAPLLLAKRIVLCDRYLYDTIITDLAEDLEYSNHEIAHLADSLSFVVPKPDLIFLVDVPEELAFRRKADVPHLEYLRKRRQLYFDFVRSMPKAVVLDGTKDIESLCRKAYERIIQSQETGRAISSR